MTTDRPGDSPAVVFRRAMLVTVLMLLGIVAGYAAEWWLSVRPDRPFGHTPLGHWTGWAGFGITLLVFGYSIRKRHGPKPGWPKRWFTVHMAAGVAGPLLVLVHSGTHWHAVVPILALVTMIIIVVSGIIGQAVHALAVSTAHEARHAWKDAGLSDVEIEERVRVQEARERRFRAWQYCHAPLTITFLVLAVLHIAGALYLGGP
jgi:hypothetical protein